MAAVARMWRRGLGPWMLVAACAWIAWSAGAAETPTRAAETWVIGEVLTTNVVTPVALTVYHPDETAALREAEAARLPALWRHDLAAADAAEGDLRAQFAQSRAQFSASIDRAFQLHPLQSVASLSDRRFFAAMAAFRAQSPTFPLSTNLAELWALGDAGLVVLNDLATQLRRFMATYLRADGRAEADPAPPVTAWIVAGPNAATVQETSLYSVGAYQRRLLELTPAADRLVVAYLVRFLRPNCTLDAAGTASARNRRLQELNVVDHFDAGVAVARSGQRIDRRLKRVLDTLSGELEAQAAAARATQLQDELQRARVESSRLQARMQAERQVNSSVGAPETRAFRLRAMLLTALGIGVGALVVAAWFAWHRRRQLASLDWPAETKLIRTELADPEADDVIAWRERALAAEARAAKATAMLRARMLPHLARWMTSELVQRLMQQRTVARTSQQRAEQEVAELAARLEKLHAPIEERRRAYEDRILQLEAELAERDRQDRELILARIESTRRRLLTDRDDAPEHFAS